jgi:3-hydroxypropanoate dehydrogenase
MSTAPTASLAIDEAAARTLFTDAHTAYRFADVPVPEETTHAIHELMKYAPTAMNSQPLRIVYLRDEAKDRLLPHLAEGNRPKTASAPLVAIMAFDTEFHRHLGRMNPQMADPDNAFPDPEGRERFARTQATLQAGYFILAARAAGLDVGPMGGFDPAGVDAEFLSDTTWRSFIVINLGTVAADGTFPRNPRHDVHEVTLVH